MTTHPITLSPDDSQWNIGRTLNWMSERFVGCSQSPRLDAQLLLARALTCDRVKLYTQIDKPLSRDERDTLRGMVKRRLAGEPVAYILGVKHWHDMELVVDRRVLIPRPETETLFDLLSAWSVPSLESDRLAGRRPVIVDLCTGSGCLALAFARRFPHALVFGVDVFAEALDIARENGRRYGVENITWCDPLDVTQRQALHACLDAARAQGDGSFVLVANPPYVTSAEWSALDAGVRDYEPRLALEAGEDGLDVARSIAAVWDDLKGSFLDGPEPLAGFFGLELADGQPQKLMAMRSPLDLKPGVIPASPRDYPQNRAFAAADLEGRVRYLFEHIGCPLPVVDVTQEQDAH